MLIDLPSEARILTHYTDGEYRRTDRMDSDGYVIWEWIAADSGTNSGSIDPDEHPIRAQEG